MIKANIKNLCYVTQLDSRNLPKISGICCINGIERPVAAFEVSNEVSRGGLEKALLKQAYTERELSLMDWIVDERKADGQKPMAVKLGEL